MQLFREPRYGVDVHKGTSNGMERSFVTLAKRAFQRQRWGRISITLDQLTEGV